MRVLHAVSRLMSTMRLVWAKCSANCLGVSHSNASLPVATAAAGDIARAVPANMGIALSILQLRDLCRRKERHPPSDTLQPASVARR